MQTAVKQSFDTGEDLVRSYAETGNPALKEKIVSVYAPLIKYVVGRINVTYSVTLDRDDLYQYGILGLLKALDRYEPERGVPFKAYAYKRINGEVIDALRKEGLIGRDKYEKVKQLENTIKTLTGSLGREPSADEVCDKLNISETEYYSTLNASQITYMTSLNTRISDGDGDFIYRIDQVVDESQNAPDELLIRKNLKDHLKNLIARLPEKPKLILALYFYEELTLADIGKVVGLTEARISQILNKTLLELKIKLG
jgi:RNA polymerase sigma factor for flagellar operon FliA